MQSEFDTTVAQNPRVANLFKVALAQGPEFVFTDEQTEGSSNLCEVADFILSAYKGDWPTMLSIYRWQSRGGQLSHRQCRVVLNSYLRERRRLLDEEGEEPLDGHHNIDPKINIGTYTVVWDAKTPDQEHRTIKFELCEYGRFAGKALYASYLYGPNNTRDYKRVGYVIKGQYKPFTRGQEDVPNRVTEAIEYLLSADKQTQLEHGEMYAEEMGHCFVCHRPITNPSSLSRGMGPVCASRWRW